MCKRFLYDNLFSKYEPEEIYRIKISGNGREYADHIIHWHGDLTIIQKRIITTLLALLDLTPAYAEETWTDLRIYLFATDVEGETRIRNVTTDVDIGFDDIVDNFDLGFMGYIEHRRDKWSYVGDVAYLKLSAYKSKASDGPLQVELDAEYEQTVLEGFVGYRILERELDSAALGLDLLVGARYIEFQTDLSSEAALLGLSASKDLSPDEDCTDTVFALRLQYGGRKGWGSMFWVDVGDGSDSSSEQFVALANYRGDGHWRYFAGYRYLNLEYETSKFEIDLDYSGPMFGASYRM